MVKEGEGGLMGVVRYEQVAGRVIVRRVSGFVPLVFEL